MAAGDGALFASANQWLKQDYLPILQDQRRYSTGLSKNLKRSDKNVQSGRGGSAVYFGVRTSSNSAVGAFPNGGPLLAADKERGTQGYETLRNSHGRFQIEHKLINLSNTDKKSFANMLKDGMKYTITNWNKDENRQLWGDGLGVLGVVSSSAYTSTTVITLDGANAYRFNPLTKYFSIGMKIDIMTQATSTVRLAACVITAVDASAGTITVTGDKSAAIAGDYITKVNAYNIENLGMRALAAASGTLHNIDPSS